MKEIQIKGVRVGVVENYPDMVKYMNSFQSYNLQDRTIFNVMDKDKIITTEDSYTNEPE